MRERYISHGQDLTDAMSEIRDITYPYMLITNRMPPQKHHTDEYSKLRKQQAYFFRSVAKTLSDVAGIDEQQARCELQKRFLRCGEIITGEGGEFDVVWIEGELVSFEQGKRYYIRSIADLSNAELAEFIEKSKNYILMQYGKACPEFVRDFKTKEV